MALKSNKTIKFEVGKYQRADSKTGYLYIAYPDDGLDMKKTGVRGEDIYKLFGEILNLKERYGFKNVKFSNKENKKLCPPLESLNKEELGTLEKLAQAPVMKQEITAESYNKCP